MKCKERYIYVYIIVVMVSLFLLISKSAKSDKEDLLDEYEFVQSELNEISEYFGVAKSATEIFNPVGKSIDDLYKVQLSSEECIVSQKNINIKSSSFVAKVKPEICRDVNSNDYQSLLYSLNLTKLMLSHTYDDSLKSIYFVSKKGFVISSSLTDAKFLEVNEFESNLFNRPYILNAEANSFLSEHALVITGPYEDMVTRDATLTFTTSILIGNELVGYLNMDVTTSNLISESCYECTFSHNKMNTNNLSFPLFINEYETGIYYEKNFSLFNIYKKGLIDNYIYVIFVSLLILLIYFRIRVLSEKAQNKIILQDSYEDELTKLLNRRGFNKKIETRIAEKYTTVAIFDIDWFKRVNDTYGHIFGDHVLKELALILKHNTRKSDIVCRFGGEEFVVILSTEDVESSTVMLERIRSVVEGYCFSMTSLNADITISCGAYIVDNYAFSLSAKLERELKKADDYLYKAKNSGRNKVLFKVIDSHCA